MAKQQILLVDADSSSARVLEVSLRSAGFTVTTADSAENALEKLEHGAPDLILTDTRLPGADGFAFVRGLRTRAELKETPIVFLTEQGALEEKLRGLELGVDDYLAKPIFVREVVTRVHMLLARKNQQRIAATESQSQVRTRFSGSLEDVAVVDLLQTIAISGKSGIAVVRRSDREAKLYFKNGQLVDAEVGDLRGEEAVYRTITWTTGIFDLEFRPVDRPTVIEATTNALLMEGMRRVDELGRLAEQLPPENTIVDVDHEALLARLNEIPDELNGILRLIDGRRTLLDLIDGSPFDDLSTLTVLSKFYFEGLLVGVESSAPEAAPVSAPAPDSARVVAALDTSSIVLEPSTPPHPHAVEAARAQTKPAPPMPSAESSAPTVQRASPSALSGPSTQRAPEPPQALRVVVPHDSELPSRESFPSAARVPAIAVAHTAVTSPPPAALEHSVRPTPAAPVVRVSAPAPLSDQPKVTPKVIVNVGDDSSPSSRSSKGIPMPSSARSLSRSDVRAVDPARYTNGHANGHSERTTASEAAVSSAAASSGVGSSAAPGANVARRAEPVSAAPFPLSTREADDVKDAPLVPPVQRAESAAAPPSVRATSLGLHAPGRDPETVTADARQLVPAGIASLSSSTVRFDAGHIPDSPAPARREEIVTSSVSAALDAGRADRGGAPSELEESSEATSAARAGNQRPDESKSHDADEEPGVESPAAAQHVMGEDEFFDAGDEGTYAGGPRSSIPAAPEPESDPLPTQIYRSTPAQRARVRRGLTVALSVVFVAAAALLVAVWQNVGTSASADAELAREDAPPLPSREIAREGWPSAAHVSGSEVPQEPSEAAVPASQPSAEAVEPQVPGAGEPEAPLAAAAAVEAVEAPAPTEPQQPEVAADPKASVAESAPKPAAVEGSKAPASQATPARAEPKRIATAAKRPPKPVSEAPKAAPPPAKTEPDRAGAVPRRSPADKPPTASYPPL